MNNSIYVLLKLTFINQLNVYNACILHDIGMFFDFKTFSHRMQMPFVAANRLHLGHTSASDVLWVI